MSYILPAPLVYQQLASTGGVANISPDLPAVIVGPCYNSITFDASSESSLATSYAGEFPVYPGRHLYSNEYILPSQKPGQVFQEWLDVYVRNAVINTVTTSGRMLPGDATISLVPESTTGSAIAGSDVITITGDNPTPFQVGEPVMITGIGVNGSTIGGPATAWVLVESVGMGTITISTIAMYTVAEVTITKIYQAFSPASLIAGSAIVTGVTNSEEFRVGDEVDGLADNAPGSTYITDIDGNTVTLSVPIPSTNPTYGLRKVKVNHVDSTRSVRVSAGDVAVVTYSGFLPGTTDSAEITYTTTVREVNAVEDNIDGGNTGRILSITLSDLPPSGFNGPKSDGSIVARVEIRKTFNNVRLYNGVDYSSTGSTGRFTLLQEPPYWMTFHGKTIYSGSIYARYDALRTDLSGAVQTISSPDDIDGILGSASEYNPLALGALLALANTTSEIYTLSVDSDDLAGYVEALNSLESSKAYSIVPLTSEIDVITAVQQHVEQMSTPTNASWRIGLVSTDIPTSQNIGPYSGSLVNSNSGDNVIAASPALGGAMVLTSSNSSFITDGVIPGDLVNITSSTNTSLVGVTQVLQVLSNQQLKVSATQAGSAVYFYVNRRLTKAQQATHVAGISSTLSSNRMVHTPCTAGVSIAGVTRYLPGYYFMCGVAGLIAGLPSQSGLTNIALAGFTDVKFSNFYFTRAQMDTMAAAGTLLIAQETQGGIPYIRHELTTDMSVLQYREIQQVKNWDYLSYFFYDILRPFIGKWNITPDSIQVVRQSLNAGGKMLQGRKLPKVGAPLTSFSIKTLKQDPDNLDNLIAEMPIVMPNPLNNASLYLIA